MDVDMLVRQDFSAQADLFATNKREESSMEEINVSVYSDDAPTPRAGILCGIFCISGILLC